jgi:O-antigen/teichoic acid export membrane protein
MQQIKWPFLGGAARRQAIMVVLGDGISFLAFFATGMILARVISVEVMGTYRQVMYLAPMVQSLLEMGLGVTVYRFWNYYEGENRLTYCWILVVVVILLGVISGLIIAVLAGPLSHWYNNPDLKAALLIIAVSPVPIMSFMLVRPIMICNGRSISATGLETSFSLAAALALIIVFWTGKSINTALSWWVGVNLLRIPVTWTVVRNYLPTGRPTGLQKIAAEVWRFVWPIQLSRLPGIFLAYFDKIVTSALLSRRDFASYSLGARELPFVGQIPSSVSGVLINHLTEQLKEKNYDGICASWRRACTSTAVVTYPIAAFAIWYALPIVRFLYSATYDESKLPFQAFAALTFIRVIEYGSLAKVFDRNGLILQAAFLGVITSILISFPLTWVLGIKGICLYLVIATSVIVIFYLFRYRQLLNRRIRAFFPYPLLIVILIWSFVSVITADILLGSYLQLEVEKGMRDLLIRLVLIGGAAGLLYTLGVLVFNRLSSFIPKKSSKIKQW